MSEKLRDEHGIPKAYSMVEALEKVEDDMNSGTDEGESGRLPYFNITANIREELTMYISVQDGLQLQDYLLEKEFDKVYDFLDDNWEESVRETLSDERIEGWEPDTTS